MASAEPAIVLGMPALRLGPQHASIPPGYSTRGVLWELLYRIANRSQRLRAFGYGLPRSRLRSALLARYYHRALDGAWRGDFGFLRAFSDATPVALFDLQTLHGREGVRRAFVETLEVVAAARFELVELINPPGEWVFLATSASVRGSASGVELADFFYAAVRVQRGDGTELSIHRDRDAALSQVGAKVVQPAQVARRVG